MHKEKIKINGIEAEVNVPDSLLEEVKMKSMKPGKIKPRYRKLEEEEVMIMTKQLKRHEDVLYRARVKLIELDHMIGEGLYVNYLEKMDEIKMKKSQLLKQMDESIFTVSAINAQIEKGEVEVKGNANG